MEDSTNTPLSEVTEVSKSQKSSSYPVKTIKDIIAFGNVIYKELGNHAYHDKDAIARANGLTYFTIKQTLSTCQQYGILVNKYGEGYKLTDLFISIVHPKDEAEYLDSILKGFNTSEIFKRLNDSFNNKRLPSTQGIISTLIRDNGLKADIAAKVAQIYIDNLNDFNLLDSNGFVCLTPKTHKAAHTPVINNPEQPFSPDAKVNEKPIEIGENTIDILIPLKNKRKANLFIPEEYKDEDLVRIIKFVEALKNE